MKAWAGLGYNRRALALHRSAVAITEEHGGRVPDDLPVGRARVVVEFLSAAVASDTAEWNSMLVLIGQDAVGLLRRLHADR